MESDHPISNIVRVSMYNTQLPNHMPTRSSSCYPTIKGSRLCYVGRFVQDKLPKLSFSSRFHVTNVHVLRNENPRSNLMYIYMYLLTWTKWTCLNSIVELRWWFRKSWITRSDQISTSTVVMKIEYRNMQTPW